MTTYSFPSIIPTSQTFELVTNTKTFQSPLSQSIQAISRKGSHWKTSMTFSNLTLDQSSQIKAVLSKLNGQEHRLLLRDYGHLNQGNYPQFQILYLFSITSSTVVTFRNVTPNITGYFKAGDFVVINGELHMITEDANSSPSYMVTVNIAPPLRDTTTLETRVYHENARGTFIVTNTPKWQTQGPYFSSITIDAIEDVLA